VPARKRWEQERLEALRRTELLDSPPEPEFDELVEIAAAACNVPMSVVSLIDEKRQWFKATFGFHEKETARELSFCDHAIRQEGIMLVEDATEDPRLRNNPSVTGETGVRFYAGVPIESPDGYPLGTLCVFDKKPRSLTAEQKTVLLALARQANTSIELRMQRRELERALLAAEDARARLYAADRRFTDFMNNGPFVAYLKDADLRYVSYNQAFANLFHISLSDWLGKQDEELFPPEFAKIYRQNDLNVLRTGETISAVEETLNADGSKTCWRSYKFPCPSDTGATWLGGISLNISPEIAREAELQRSKAELERANELLRELAATDPLTGLANRRIFDERLQLEFARSRRKRLALAVLMLDVDNFKHRNDTYGHDDGDRALRRVGHVLRETVRETDVAARYGGEEFVVLLPEADETQALGLAERILDAIHAESWAHEPLTISIGAAGLEDATPNAERLVILADEALYAAKRAGKNRVVGYRRYYQQLLLQLKNNPPIKPSLDLLKDLKNSTAPLN
jgi:diguanylate cyclase (GGDEF)-like protein